MRVNRRTGKLLNFSRNAAVSSTNGHHCRADFPPIPFSRARGAGKICDCRGDCQRRGGQRFNP